MFPFARFPAWGCPIFDPTASSPVGLPCPKLGGVQGWKGLQVGPRGGFTQSFGDPDIKGGDLCDDKREAKNGKKINNRSTKLGFSETTTKTASFCPRTPFSTRGPGSRFPDFSVGERQPRGVPAGQSWGESRALPQPTSKQNPNGVEGTAEGRRFWGFCAISDINWTRWSKSWVTPWKVPWETWTKSTGPLPGGAQSPSHISRSATQLDSIRPWLKTHGTIFRGFRCTTHFRLPILVVGLNRMFTGGQPI